MKKIYIIGDFNDADYGKALIEIDEAIFEKFLPFIEAINNFQPYIRRDSIGGIDYHNFVSYREDLGEMTVYEKYPQFDVEYINEFMNIFVNPIPVPQEGIDGEPPHTIVSLKDVVTDKEYINTDDLHQRHSANILAYYKELNEICSYKRKSDGKSLICIPFAEMTDEENELIRRKRNLWMKYS
jgi:hypothetical protein